MSAPYSRHPYRCTASGEDFYTYASQGRLSESGEAPCPTCGKSVKLMRSGAGHRRIIPVHNSAKERS